MAKPLLPLLAPSGKIRFPNRFLFILTASGCIPLHNKPSLSWTRATILTSALILSVTGEVKLADFGVSAQLVNSLSYRNSFVGTSCWMAPEVIQVLGVSPVIS